MAGYRSWEDRPWERRDWDRRRRERPQGAHPGEEPWRERAMAPADWRWDEWRGEGWPRHRYLGPGWEAGERRGGRPRMDRPWVEPTAERRSIGDTRGLVEWEDRGPLEWLGDRGRRARRPSRGPKGYMRSDERIHEEVCERVARSGVDASEVEVRVEKREVTLAGTVSSREEKWWLEDLADDVFGVEEVHNHLRVSRAGDVTGAPTQH